MFERKRLNTLNSTEEKALQTQTKFKIKKKKQEKE